VSNTECWTVGQWTLFGVLVFFAGPFAIGAAFIVVLVAVAAVGKAASMWWDLFVNVPVWAFQNITKKKAKP
jgi:hypothetical protein